MKTPSFVVIGAEKSGTTSLYYYLRQHPGIFMPAVKELNHLVHHPDKRSIFQGPDITYGKACRSRDDYFRAFADARDGCIIGEIAHVYLYAPESAAMIRDVLGTPMIIAIIRDPVQRAHSQFVFHRKLGLEPLPTFEEALDAEERRIKAGWDPVYHYFRRGLYGEQLARYYALFPKDRITVHKFESFFSDTVAAMAKLYEAVGADATFSPDVRLKYVPGGDPRAVEFVASRSDGVPEPDPIATETLRRLADSYRDDIHKAEQLTGLDLSDWLR